MGPVHVAIDFKQEKTLEATTRWGRQAKDWPKGSYLYVKPIVADRLGTYHVRVKDPKGKLLAEASVEATKDTFHPWMPWLHGLRDPEMPWEGIALPAVDDIGPAAFLTPGKEKKGDLPTLLPSDDKPALTIKMDGKEITIRAESEFTSSRPDYHFLARWWVNGKPFVPKQAETLWAFSGYGRVSTDKELRLGVTVRPDRLGAKTGDKIGLQLMHCEGEWDWVRSGARGKYASSKADGPSVRVSNRIEFIAP
jgi:hypothetical protein